MKRYICTDSGSKYESYGCPEMKEYDNGDYVTYKDYQKLQEQLEKAEEVIKHYKSYCVPQWVEVPGMSGMRGVQEVWLAREYFKEKESK